MKMFLRKQVLTFSQLCLAETLRGRVLRKQKMDLWLRAEAASPAPLSPLGGRVKSHNGWMGWAGVFFRFCGHVLSCKLLSPLRSSWL